MSAGIRLTAENLPRPSKMQRRWSPRREEFQGCGVERYIDLGG
jgi:hypothetical protein